MNPPFANSAQLCANAKSFAVPAAAQLSLAVAGTAQVAEGVAVHFLVATDAPTVDLSVSDGGTNAVLCGTAPGNASATIVGAQLQQSLPATQRTFELCLTRSNVATGSIAATLTASLGATVENLQAWVHPTSPQTCQGLVDTAVTTQRRAVHAAGTWTNVDGTLTVTKAVVGDAPANSTFDIAIHGPNSLVQSHTFPDLVGDPWSHTFTDLPVGNYTVTETATGGATHVVVTPNATTLVGADLSPTVTVTNSFVGQLKLTKRTDIPTGKTFGFDVNCTYQSVNVNAWTNPIRLSANQSFTSPEIPAGAKCSITESDTGAAISTLIQLDSLGVQSQSIGTQASGIAIANGATVNVEFLNTMALGSTIASTSTSGAPRNTTIAATSTTIDNTVNPLGSTTSNGRTPNDTHNLATSGTDADQLFTVGGFTLLSGVAILFGTRRRRNLKRPSK